MTCVPARLARGCEVAAPLVGILGRRRQRAQLYAPIRCDVVEIQLLRARLAQRIGIVEHPTNIGQVGAVAVDAHRALPPRLDLTIAVAV